MRSKILILLMFWCIQSVSGQGEFLFAMESSSKKYPQIDLSEKDLFFEFDEGIKNNGDDNISVGWSISNIKGCPSEWDLKVVDKYSDYTIRPDYEYTFAIDIAPAEFSPFNIVMLPNGVSGSCALSVQFFDPDNPAIIYDEAKYELKVNTDDAGVRSIVKEDDPNIFQVYPNPSNNVINIKTESAFDSGQIYSSDGQFIMNIDSNQKEIRVADLQVGVYRIILNYSDNTEGTSTFIKIN